MHTFSVGKIIHNVYCCGLHSSIFVYHLAERDFQMLFLDIFQGGAETSSTYLEMVILYLVLHQDVQEKIFQEINTVISHQEPSHEHMEMMTYTQATLLEVHRLGKLIPNLVPRKVLNDFQYRGFHFKKGTGLLADLHSAFHTEEFGGVTDSWNFRPERFISLDGQLNSLSKRLVHFSVGKRNCPGNRVAEISSFLIVVSLLQRFKLSLVHGDEAPSTEMQFGFTARPQPFRFYVSNRA
jgi:cytochrome P450